MQNTKTERKVFVYKDEKHKPIMVYLDRAYPYGIYLGHFDTMKEAEVAVNEWKHKASTGVPLCNALVDFQITHGAYDMDGLELVNEYEVA